MEKVDVLVLAECIEDAKVLVREKRLLESQSAIVELAVALFNVRFKK